MPYDFVLHTPPYLRGGSVLSKLATPHTRGVSVDAVEVNAGHVALLVRERKMLCVLDAVPRKAQLTAAQNEYLAELLAGSSAHERVGTVLTFDHSAPVASLQFQDPPGAPLRLVVVQEDGVLMSWQWCAADLKWAMLPPVTLADGAAVKVLSARCTFYPDKIAWHQTERKQSESTGYAMGSVEVVHSVRWRELHFPQDPAGSLRLGAAPSELGVANLAALHSVTGGMWFVTPSKLRYVATSAGVEGEIAVHDEAGPEDIRGVAAACVHATTQDLVVLERTGGVAVCVAPSAGARARVHRLATLPPLGDEGVRAFFAHRLLLGVVGAEQCRLYSTRSGAEVARVSLPNSFRQGGLAGCWSYGVPAGASGVGLWSAYGVWRLREVPLTEQADLAAQKNSGSEEASALCRLWHLDHLAAKYALDGALSAGRPPVDAARASEITSALSPALQNPAVVLGLLGDQHFPVADASATEFTKQFHAGGPSTSEVDEIKSRLAARDAFHAFTPLNSTVIELVDQYAEKSMTKVLSRSTGDDHTPELAVSMPVTEADVQSLSFVELQELESEAPLALLRALLGALMIFGPGQEDPMDADVRYESASELLCGGPTSGSVPVLPSSGRPPSENVLDIMCRLLYEHAPGLLLRFVEAVVTSTPKVEGYSRGALSEQGSPSHDGSPVDRAIAALPLLLPSTLNNDDDVERARLTARTSLLCLAAKPSEALRVMLKCCPLTEAVDFVRSRKDEDLNHFELFHVLLNHCLQHEAPDTLEDVFGVAPASYSVFDLLALLRDKSLSAGSPALSPILERRGGEGEIAPALSVGNLRPFLLALLERGT